MTPASAAGRRALSLLAVVVALLVTTAAVAAATPLKVSLGIVTVSSQMALDIAATQGIFARHGFDVEVHPLASGAQANQALAANQVDWSAGGIESTIIAASAGLPFKPYAMYAKGGDSLGLLVRRDAKIGSPVDLKGKRIAVVAGTASAQGLSDLLQANHIEDADVRRVNANFGTMGQMLASGAVDGMVGLEPFLTVTQDRLGDSVVLLTRFGRYVQGGGFFLISDRWAAAHPDQIEPAVEALAEALQFIRHHPDAAAHLVAPFLNTDADVIARSSKVFDFAFDIDSFTIASLRKTSDYLARQKMIPQPVDVDRLIAPAIRVTSDLRQHRPDLLR